VTRIEEGLAETAVRKLKAKLPLQTRLRLRELLAEPLAFLCRRDLALLARIFLNDKWNLHWYAPHYERHLSHLRKKKIVLLEIGVGGYGNPLSGGESLRMWRSYFRRARVFGIDIVDKTAQEERRIRTFKGDQTDEKFLREVIDRIGPPDVIIDDGSHVNSHVIKTFRTLFPLLADKGVYVVEDTEMSYWPEYGGSSEDLISAPTSMNMLKSLADGINYKEFVREDYVPSYFDQWVASVHFYHNIVFVHKGRNDEGSILHRER
jgi:hypothetical protein